MKLTLKKIKSILIVSGISVFIGGVLFTSNLNHIKLNNKNTYASIAARWSSNFTDNKSYAKTAAKWSGNTLVAIDRNFSKRAASWSSSSFDKSYSETASTWSNTVYKVTKKI